jgi:peptidoglycan/xylan/chitin deacetylase (PgdA/CDA1 family)
MALRMLFDVLAPPGERSRLSVLIFHRVRPRVDPLFPNEPDAGRFEAQLRWVKEWFHVMPLAEAVAGLRSGTLPARPLSITFDDGYADNATLALPILRKLGLTATFFIATGYLNGGRMWNDTVIEAVRAAPGPRLDLSRLGLGEHSIETVEDRRAALAAVIRQLKHLPQAERQRKADSVAETVGVPLPDTLMLTDRQVLELRRGGMAIGAHTVSHPILATLPDDEARREIAESKRALERLLGEPVSLFAYPNGVPEQDYKAVHVAMAKELGFEAAVSTAKGTASVGSDLYQIPRFTPWDRTRWRYGLRLARNARHDRLAAA